MLKKIVAIILIATMIAFSFCGCEKEDKAKDDVFKFEDEKSDTDKDTSDNHLKYDKDAEVCDGENLPISFWYPSDYEEICEEYADKYQHIQSNVIIETKCVPWNEYWSSLEDAFKSNNGPDIFWMNTAYNDKLLNYCRQLPEDVFPTEAMQSDFLNHRSSEINGNLYYIDLAYTSQVMMYNKDMWKEAGLTDKDIPKTWEDLEKVAKKLTKKDKLGKFEVTGFDFNGGNNFVTLLSALNYQSGERQFTEDDEATNYSSIKSIENMEYLASYIKEKGISEYSQVPNRDALGKGKTAIICDYTWVYLYLDDIYPNLNVGVFPMPTKEGANAIQSMQSNVSPCLSNQSDKDQREASEDFLKYLLASDSFIKDYSMDNCMYPAKYSLQDDTIIKNHEVLSILAKTIDKSILINPVPKKVEDIRNYYLQYMYLTGEITAQEAVMSTDNECHDELVLLFYHSREKLYKYIFMFEESSKA